MASHRKPRNTGTRIAGMRTSPALGITTAALTSVALLSQSAQAAPEKPKPSLEEVQKKVDGLYHDAGVATEKYNAAKVRTAEQRKAADKLLDQVAARTEQLNTARTELGSFAAAQYRTGGVSDTATLMLADDPDQYFDQSHLMKRLTSRQKSAVDDYQKEQVATAKKRREATKSLAKLTESQQELRDSKQTVQQKLGSARKLLSKLTAEEKARLAEIERKKQEEARRKAEEKARKEAAEKKRREEEERKKREEGGGGSGGSGSDTGGGSGGSGGSGAGSGGSSGDYATKAAKVLAFARAQIGKPYVWGATGPNAYDCSGFTQAAWRAAGITLPRTTWDQVKVGTTVSVDNAKPGDLVFFYNDISHVGIYVGGGNMIHAPKPGANVRTESIYYMPIHSVVRPA
ncbi:NlpC/P60 family protein [Streptomyces sp. NPDC058045]|uniref:C40 family peptidase n=1 Tax=Streptomyces sp. NPDC058045 TaxID=3346311 RepID=UPI0036E71C6F